MSLPSTTCNLHCSEQTDDVISFNLYCIEEISDVVSLNSEICNDLVSCDSYSDRGDDDENFIVGLFNAEVDQMQGPELLAIYGEDPEVITARRAAVKWMFKVHTHYQFRPETGYLSVNYFDRFILSHSLLQLRKLWPWQLLSVACLSLAAKMEETNVPILLDLQIKEPGFFFKPKTIQRMELIVMNNLKWRLRMITPFDFVYDLVSRIPCLSFCSVSPRVSDIIISTTRVIDFLDYPPSVIAAAAMLLASNETVDDEILGCFHKRVNKEMVKRCYNLMRRNVSELLVAH